MSEPCIKGSVFQSCIDDLRSAIDAGRVTLEELGASLSAEELGLLDEKIAASQWYPITSYTRIIETLQRIDAPGDADYFRRRGMASAQRLVEAGLYQQLSIVSEAASGPRPTPEQIEASRGELRHRLKVANTLASSIYNVGKWTTEGGTKDEPRLRIVVTDAAAYSQPMREAIEGFYNGCIEMALGQTHRLWQLTSNDADRFVLEINLPQG